MELLKELLRNLADLNEAPKFQPAKKVLSNLSSQFDKAVVTTKEIGSDNTFMAGVVLPDGSWTVLLTDKPRTIGPDINRKLAKGKAPSVNAAKKAVVAAFPKAQKKI